MHETVIKATVVITSKNRRDDLRAAIQSCVNQRPQVEILLIDDGSSDGTSMMVAKEFPSVRLHRHEHSTGLVVGRNRAAKLASGDVVVSIDDDAVFTTPDVVARTIADFDDDRIGAVAIPFIDVNKSPAEHQRSPDPDQTFIADRFIGTAHAVRKDVFLKLGGYRESFFHQGEEGDYCLRMMDAGYFVKLGNSDPIHHFESPKRDTRRMDLYGRRNDLLVTWLNVPMPGLIPRMAAVIAGGVWFGIRSRRPWRAVQGMAAGVVACWRQRGDRRPVCMATYEMMRRLRKNGPMRLPDSAASR